MYKDSLDLVYVAGNFILLFNQVRGSTKGTIEIRGISAWKWFPLASVSSSELWPRFGGQGHLVEVGPQEGLLRAICNAQYIITQASIPLSPKETLPCHIYVFYILIASLFIRSGADLAWITQIHSENQR